MSRKIYWMAGLLIVALLFAACAPAAPAVTEAPPAEEPAAEEPAAEEPTEEPTEEAAPSVPMSDLEQVHIVTTATNVVGVGSYVAAEAYALPAGEDPAAQPPQAFIFPYAIYPDMLVEDIADFDAAAQTYRIKAEGFTFEWNLEAPEGSAAALAESDGVVVFMADVEGTYTLSLTATDEAGNVAETSWEVNTASYVGSGAVATEDAKPPQCAVCHGDQTEGWLATGHATFFTLAVDGEMSDHYGPNCISCHTTGFNNRPEAANGGFDDIAMEAGWEFPGALAAGNWDAMVANFPQVAALANIQCESCHGPGSEHSGTGPISSGLEYGTCAQCHAEEPYHNFPQQWEMSGHADRSARAFWYPTGEDHLACVQCHTGGGYIDAANGVPQEERRNTFQPITCAVCHDPHSVENPNQLRIYDSVSLPNGVDATDAGPAATCMTCHNTRRDPVATVEGENFGTPHYSSAAEMMYGSGGYNFGEELPSSLHAQVVEGMCIGCHMAPTPGNDDAGNPLPGHNEIGGHTFAMVNADGVENIAACQTCHESAESFDFEARGDYDGDGTVETNDAEIDGLLELLRAELEARGVVFLPSYPYITMPDGASAELKGAVYNYKLISDSPTAAHNLKYQVALLQLSYEKLTGSPVPNAESPE